ncbi:hypothetical protein [Sorangium sp. So ce128]|uniref:hypothetical protein n=1 Tax=Sorangium sp. So ce128 TaxID=3133281 RepID=UPI003F5EA1A3
MELRSTIALFPVAQPEDAEQVAPAHLVEQRAAFAQEVLGEADERKPGLVLLGEPEQHGEIAGLLGERAARVHVGELLGDVRLERERLVGERLRRARQGRLALITWSMGRT